MDKNKSSARLFSFFSHSPFILYNNINESSSINVCRLLLCSFHSNQILFDAATVRSIDSVSSKLFQFWRFNTKKRICCCLLCVHHRLLSINSMPMPSLSSQWLHLTFTSSFFHLLHSYSPACSCRAVLRRIFAVLTVLPLLYVLLLMCAFKFLMHLKQKPKTNNLQWQFCVIHC